MEQLIGIGAFIVMTFVQVALVFCIAAANRAAISKEEPPLSIDETTLIER